MDDIGFACSEINTTTSVHYARRIKILLSTEAVMVCLPCEAEKVLLLEMVSHYKILKHMHDLKFAYLSQKQNQNQYTRLDSQVYKIIVTFLGGNIVQQHETNQ